MSAENFIQKKIIADDKLLLQQLAVWKFKNDIIVFTNGCFDILHRGHVDYLYMASKLGNKLVLGLNSDNSVKRIKGPDRPVNDQHSRAIILASMQFIDLVVFFDEDTPYELIKKVQPDVLVKGNDYKPDEIVGADIVTAKGGTVQTIQLTPGFSTTGIINKLKD